MKHFIKQGRNGIMPLIAKKLAKCLTNFDQLQSDNEGNLCLEAIHSHYNENPYGFEMCKDLLEKMDNKFQDFH